MFKTTQQLLKRNRNVDLLSKRLQAAKPVMIPASLHMQPYSQQHRKKQQKDSSGYLPISLSLIGLLGFSLYGSTQQSTEAEGQDQPRARPAPPSFYPQTPSKPAVEQQTEADPKLRLKRRLEDAVSIPLMLQQREQQKMKEYAERQAEDVKSIEKGVSEADIRQMHDLDRMYGQDQDKEMGSEEEEYIRRRMEERKSERQSGEDDEEEYIKDPYAKQKTRMMKHQEYRTIKVGPEDLLKNGQMIQVSVCDPFDDNKYHPTDKVIIAKHNDQYYALGSFCGFDYTNLANGAFLGEKLICPTCGSTYSILNGFVEQGPAMRNISSFLIQQRENLVQLVMPEHVPAFSKKKFIKKQNIDPRTFVILGDSETALAAIDGLRAGFSGKIIVIPSSPFGQFENTDILNRKFSPVSKNEVFMVEEDYLDRANVDVVKGEIKTVDLNNNRIVVKGVKDPIEFDKVLIAWGSYKKRLNKEYSNVFYLEDRHSHARCHNELLKAKTILVMGGTFEAYQTASSIRSYLDSVGYQDPQIILIDPDMSQIHQTFGKEVGEAINQLMREQRISVMMQAEITKIQGMNKIEGLYFKKNAPAKDEKNVEFYLRPDIVIAENGVGAPKYDLKSVLAPAKNAENGEPPLKLGIDATGVPASDVKFSLHYNDLFSPILAAGSCTQYPSFIHKVRVRTNDMRYNIEAGWFAAMNMMNKRVEFRFFPLSAMNINGKPIYFVGERNSPFHEVITNGSVEDGKFVAFYIYGNEITGFMTCGYQNLHLYLWEAMKLLIMPPATQLRNGTMDYKHIVQKVLAMRPYIRCKRTEIVSLPSIMLAEFDGELAKSQEFSEKMKQNVNKENMVQKEKFRKMKEKYDREGVEFIEDEMDMAERSGMPAQARAPPSQRAETMSGMRKPGQTSTMDRTLQRKTEINMGGADQDNQKNPLSLLINAAKKTIGRD